jgi:hypothetical protein
MVAPADRLQQCPGAAGVQMGYGATQAGEEVDEEIDYDTLVDKTSDDQRSKRRNVSLPKVPGLDL